MSFWFLLRQSQPAAQPSFLYRTITTSIQRITPEGKFRIFRITPYTYRYTTNHSPRITASGLYRIHRD